MPSTQFKVYLQPPSVRGFERPKVISIDSVGPVGNGPSDQRFAAFSAPRKRALYSVHRPDRPLPLFPWGGHRDKPPARPQAGHFIHLDPDADEGAFAAAQAFAFASYTVEVWNYYASMVGLAGFKDWNHNRNMPTQRPLEIIVRVDEDGAGAGFGFVELGKGIATKQFRHRGSMWKQPDIIVHEVTHQLLFAQLGFPDSFLRNFDWTWYGEANLRVNGEFVAFAEAIGDVMACLCALGFPEIRSALIQATEGDLNVDNVVARIADMEGPEGAMVGLRNLATPLSRDDVEHKNGLEIPHHLSLTVSSIFYALLVDVYEDEKSESEPDQALLLSRDYLGKLLALVLGSDVIRPNQFSFATLQNELNSADNDLRTENSDRVKPLFDRQRLIR